MSNGIALESREGSSPVCVRSVAAALRDEFLDVYQLPAWQKIALRALAYLGPRVVRSIIEQNQRGVGLDPNLAASIDVEDVAAAHTDYYSGLDGPFDAIVIGAPNGGVAHIASALGAPFLSQHFVFSFRGASATDDVAAYRKHGDALAAPILTRNPNVAVINHYDPVHDRWLISSLNHIRLKLLALPEVYKRFIQTRLRPGGAIVWVDCPWPWQQYRIGPRHTFQVGGLGGLADQDFLRGTTGVRGWSLDLPLESQPESEWGTLPELGQAIDEFARAAERGYRVVRLQGAHPEWYAELAYRVWQKLFARESIEPQGTVIEMFTRVDPAAVRRSSLLPLWLPWNCTDSLDFLKRMTPRIDRRRPVLFTLLSNFSLTPDLTSWDQWAAALAGFDGQFLGQRKRLFPSDPAGMWRTGDALREWCDAHLRRFTARMTVDEILRAE